VFLSKRYIKVLLVLAFISIAVALLIRNIKLFMPFIADDALISLRYAHRLIAGEGLNWTDGKPVEGYSNLLWILLVSSLGACGLDLIIAARFLGVFCISVLCFSLVYTALFSKRTMKMTSLTVALLMVCFSSPVVVWAIGGLEQPLIAALLGLSLAFCFQILGTDSSATKATWAASTCLGLLCITRPDSPLFVTTIFLAVAISRGKGHFFQSCKLLLIPVVMIVLQLGFRLLYYGEWVPNTALVKISPSINHIRSGIWYVVGGFRTMGPFSHIAMLGMICSLIPKSTRSKGALLLLPTIAWTCYVIFLGGDTQPAWRHIVPLVVFFAFAIMLTTDLIQELLTVAFDRCVSDHLKKFGSLRFRQMLARMLVAASILAAAAPLFFLYFANQRNDLHREGQGHLRGAITERWEWDCQAMGYALKDAFYDKQPLMAVTTAGCLPYWSELPSLDMLGLNDHYIAHHPPKNFGLGWIGHELGDGKYVLSRKPDLISFGLSKKNAKWLSGRQMQRDPDFYKDYKLVRYMGKNPHEVTTRIWARQYSEKIGITETANKITIPGFLFNGNDKTIAYINNQGKFVIPVSAKQPASITINSIAKGPWKHRIIQYGSSNELTMTISPTIDNKTEIAIETQDDGPVEVYLVTLHREF
jgi:arabinofuranosyltransferase